MSSKQHLSATPKELEDVRGSRTLHVGVMAFLIVHLLAFRSSASHQTHRRRGIRRHSHLDAPDDWPRQSSPLWWRNWRGVFVTPWRSTENVLELQAFLAGMAWRLRDTQNAETRGLCSWKQPRPDSRGQRQIFLTTVGPSPQWIQRTEGPARRMSVSWRFSPCTCWRFVHQHRTKRTEGAASDGSPTWMPQMIGRVIFLFTVAELAWSLRHTVAIHRECPGVASVSGGVAWRLRDA